MGGFSGATQGKEVASWGSASNSDRSECFPSTHLLIRSVFTDHALCPRGHHLLPSTRKSLKIEMRQPRGLEDRPGCQVHRAQESTGHKGTKPLGAQREHLLAGHLERGGGGRRTEQGPSLCTSTGLLWACSLGVVRCTFPNPCLPDPVGQISVLC